MPSDFLDTFYDKRKLSPRQMKPDKFIPHPKSLPNKNTKRTKYL